MMSKRVALSGGVVLGAALVFGLGYYFGGYYRAPVVSAPPIANTRPPAEPNVAPQAAQSTGVQAAQPAAIVDPVEEHNRAVGQIQTAPGVGVIEKMARVGDEVVTLHFKPPQVLLSSKDDFIDDAKSPGFFEPLARDAAAGSDAAAHQLWQSLTACKGGPTTEGELQTKLEEARQRFAQTGGATVNGTMTYEQALGFYQKRYERCQGVKPKMYDDALQYLREAADRGVNPSVEIEYAVAIATSNPGDSRKRFESLWQQGHMAGLAGLAQDSVPHRLAWYAATIAEFDGLREPNELLKQFRTLAAALQNQTSPSEYQEAAKEAARLLRNNPNCCTSP